MHFLPRIEHLTDGDGIQRLGDHVARVSQLGATTGVARERLQQLGQLLLEGIASSRQVAELGFALSTTSKIN